MGYDDDGYIRVPNPNNPNERIRAKVLNFEKVKGEDHVYRLHDGTKIILMIDVDTIYKPIDPNTGRPAVNPGTGEPIISINWGVRVKTIYSEKAMREIEGGF